jgi:hypothetical protein
MEERSSGQCPLCGGALEVGFLLDRTHTAYKPMEWIGGEPVPSFWVGTKISEAVHRQIEAFRCTQCGYVMLFARQQV